MLLCRCKGVSDEWDVVLALRCVCVCVCVCVCYREVHDMCTLLGYGADAICPYLLFETCSSLRRQGKLDPPLEDQEIFSNFVAATARGVSKVMAKMGISTLHSYKVWRWLSEATRWLSGATRWFSGGPMWLLMVTQWLSMVTQWLSGCCQEISFITN